MTPGHCSCRCLGTFEPVSEQSWAEALELFRIPHLSRLGRGRTCWKFVLTHQSLDFGAYGGGGSHCALWVLFCYVLLCLGFFFFRAGHVTDGFVREPCGRERRFTSPQIGGAHVDFIRKRLLKQQEEAEEARKEMALVDPTQLINYSMATGE